MANCWIGMDIEDIGMKDKIIVKFKSKTKNYLKERMGVKNNTFRRAYENDDRFIKLAKGEATHIEIRISPDGSNPFIRKIRDVTFWDGYCIITWEDTYERQKTAKAIFEELNPLMDSYWTDDSKRTIWNESKKKWGVIK